MAVESTRSLPMVPILETILPGSSGGSKDEAGSFSQVLKQTERSPREDKAPREQHNSWREDKPISQSLPKKKTQPPAESPPQAPAPPPPPTVSPEPTAETTAAPEDVVLPAEEAVVQDPDAEEAPTAVVLPAQPILLAPQTIAPTPSPDATVTAVVSPERSEVQAAPIAAPVPEVVAATATPSAVDISTESKTAEEIAIAQVAEVQQLSADKTPAKENSPPPTNDPALASPANPPVDNAAEEPQNDEQPPPSTTAEAEQVPAAPSVEPSRPTAEKKDDREDRKDKDEQPEVAPTVAQEVVAPPPVAESSPTDRGERAVEAITPPESNATAPATDAPRPNNAQPTPTVSGVENTAPRFPPGLTGRASSSREAAARPEVDTTRFLRRVVGAFQAAEERGGDVKLRLRPPELGVVQIQVKIQDGALTARMDAETPAARNLLLDNLPQLRERLAEQGMRIEKFEVNVSDRQSGGQPDPGSQSRDQPAHTPRTNPLRPPLREEPAPRTPRVGPDPTGLNVLV